MMKYKEEDKRQYSAYVHGDNVKFWYLHVFVSIQFESRKT